MSQLDPDSVPPAMGIPVQALPYSVPHQQMRPGIITAVGVMCIVVACLSGFGSLMTGMYGYVFWKWSRMAASMSAATATTTTTTSSGGVYSWSMTSGQGMVAGSSPAPKQSLPPADASAAVIELTKTLSLDGAHIRELDKLMRSHGRVVLGVDEDASVGADTVRSALTGHGTDADKGSVYFTTPQGRVDVFGDHATFASADGGTSIDTSVTNHSESMNQNVTATTSGPAGTPSTTLTTAQVAQVMAAVRQAQPVPLNPKQLASLRAELSKPNQQLVTPGDAAPVGLVTNQTGSNATIRFDTGSALVLGPQGQVVSSGPFFPTFTISGSVMGMVIGEAAASIAVAIYLLVVGIMVFRSYPKTPRLLRIYAVLKIALALLAGTAITMMGYQFASGIAASSGMPSPGSASVGFIIWGIMIAVLGAAFPIAVLITSSTRTFREYFNSVAV